MKRVPVDIVILLVIILTSLGFAFWKVASLSSDVSPAVSGDPVEVVEIFINATHMGDKQRAFLCLSTESQRRVQRFPGDKLETLANGVLRNANYRLELVENNGKTARVVAKRDSRGDARQHRRGIPYMLVKERGSWKIDMVRTERLWYEGPRFSPYSGSFYQNDENRAIPQNRERK
ncbi:MAG TPA: hypothetical protein PLU88_07160 [Armatimonadota bacterium]|nr:hypothetical protein [Armatimonadota bacterium]